MKKKESNQLKSNHEKTEMINEANTRIFSRIKDVMRDRQITQTDLADRCAWCGYNISQSEISKLLSGSEKMDPCKLAVICRALNIKSENLLSLVFDSKVTNDGAGFITDVNDKKFKGYIGDFYGYFCSTKDKDTIHMGVFKFFKDKYSNDCKVSFRFSTGQKDKNKKPVYSEFVGTAKISDALRAICCEMTSTDDSNDVSYIIFKHDFIKNQQCECRFGMVVTIGAGIKRLPVAHKILICRQELSPEDIPFVRGQLRLNDNSFLVSEQKYKEFTKDANLPIQAKQYFNSENNCIKDRAKQQIYYSFTEEDIKSVGLKDSARIINLLRDYSESQMCKKIGPKGEEYVLEYLEGKKEENK